MLRWWGGSKRSNGVSLVAIGQHWDYDTVQGSGSVSHGDKMVSFDATTVRSTIATTCRLFPFLALWQNLTTCSCWCRKVSLAERENHLPHCCCGRRERNIDSASSVYQAGSDRHISSTTYRPWQESCKQSRRFGGYKRALRVSRIFFLDQKGHDPTFAGSGRKRFSHNSFQRLYNVYIWATPTLDEVWWIWPMKNLLYTSADTPNSFTYLSTDLVHCRSLRSSLSLFQHSFPHLTWNTWQDLRSRIDGYQLFL